MNSEVFQEMEEETSSKELIEIKLELNNLSKSIKSLTSQFEQMNSVLIQILNNLQLTGDYSEDETIEFVQNEKLLSRLKELGPNQDDKTYQ